jgi:hypothetical protein
VPVEPRPDANEAAVEAVAGLVQEIDPGAFPQAFILAVNVLDRDGKRGMWTLCPPDQKVWESLGLAEMVRLLEYAKEARDEDG